MKIPLSINNKLADKLDYKTTLIFQFLSTCRTMKTLLHFLIRNHFASGSSILLFFVLVFSCTEKFSTLDPTTNVTSAGVPLKGASVAEQYGQLFYNHVQAHALENPLANFTLEEQQKKNLQTAFDNLKTNGNINFEAILDRAVSSQQISKTGHYVLLEYNKNLVDYVKLNADVDKSFKWCLAQEEAVTARTDLPDRDKSYILTHQALLRYYIKQTLESSVPAGSSKARTENLQDILCYVGCAVNNISAYSSVGHLADSTGGNGSNGTYIGAAAGLIFTILNSASCGCDKNTCQGATAVSTPDVCYSTSTGLVYTAWGYGQTPNQFRWSFYRESLSNSPIVDDTYSDQYTFTNAMLNGASKVAVQLASLCPPGTYYYSQSYWTAPSDNGKPRPIINVSQNPNDPNQVQYFVGGANVQSFQWSYIPPYRGSVINQSGNSITVQWQPNLRIGVNVDTYSGCGTASATAY